MITLLSLLSNFASVNRAITNPPDFEDEYTTNTGWTQVGTAVTVDSGTADKLSMDACPANAEHRVHKALGLTLTDTLWYAESEITVTAENEAFSMGFSAGTGVMTSSGDNLGVFAIDPTGSSKRLGLFRHDAGVYDSVYTPVIVLSTLYYIRIERTSATNLRLSIFTDSARTTHITDSPLNFTIPSTIISLDTIQHSSKTDGSAGTTSLTMDNTKVWDNASP